MLDAGMLDDRNEVVPVSQHPVIQHPVPMNACPTRRKQTRPIGGGLYPFESHWMDLPSGRMHYLDEGPDRSLADAVRGRRCCSFMAIHLVVSLAAADRGTA